MILSRIKIIILENLSIINKIQSHSFNNDNNFENVKIKSIINV